MTLLLSNVIFRSSKCILPTLNRQVSFKTIFIKKSFDQCHSNISLIWARQNFLTARSRFFTNFSRQPFENHVHNRFLLQFYQRKSFGKQNELAKNNVTNNNEWNEMLKLPLIKRMHVMFKKYWYVAIPFHCVNSALWFAGCYILAKCGINGEYLINFIKPYIQNSQNCPQFIKHIFEKDADKLGTLAVALILYKLLTPGRYATTVFGTVYLLRYLLQRGILVKTAADHLKSVRHSYLSHAVSKNIQKQRNRLKKMTTKNMKKPK